MFSDWAKTDITFLSGFFASAAAKLFHSSVAPDDKDTLQGAISITLIMLLFYVVVSVYFVNKKTKAAAGGDGIATDFDDAIATSIDHITGSLGWCVAIAWYGLNPDWYRYGLQTIGVLIGAIIFLIILEAIYRRTKKGTCAYHVMNLIQQCAQGAFAWQLATTLNIKYMEWYKVPPNPLDFTMYLLTVVIGVFHMEIINQIAARCAQHEDATELAYGESVMTMWKATPIKSSHLLLRGFVEKGWAPNLYGACAACTIPTLVAIGVFHTLRKLVPTCGVEKNVGAKYALSTVGIVSGSISWMCGQLFGDAYVAWLTASWNYVNSPVGAQRAMLFFFGLVLIFVSLILADVRLSGKTEKCCPAEEEEESEYEEEEDEDESKKALTA